MAKTRAKKSSRLNSTTITLLVTAAVIVVAGVFLVISGSSATTTAVAEAPQRVSPSQYQEQFSDATHMLIDVRTPEEFATGHIAGALNVPVDSLDQHLSEIPTDQPVVVYCRSGNRSTTAAQILSEAGYTQVYNLGGINDWTAQGYALQ